MVSGEAAEHPAAEPRLALVPLLVRLFRCLNRGRKRQLFSLLGLMVIGAAAEMMTIGAVITFLALLAAPANGADYPRLVIAMESIGGSAGHPPIVGAAILLLVAAFGAAVTRLLLAWVTQDFVFKVGHEMGTASFSRALHRSYREHVRSNSSDLLAGIENIYTITFSILLPLMQGVAAAIIALCLTAVLLAIDPLVTAIGAGFIGCIYLGVSVFVRRLLVRGAATMSWTLRARYRVVQEGLGGIRDVLLYRKQQVFADEFLRLDARYRSSQALNVFASGAPRHIVEFAAIALIVALTIVLSGGRAGLIGAIPILGALALGAQRLLPLLQQAYSGWSQLTGNRAALADALALLDTPTHARPPAPTTAIRGHVSDVQFVGVEFGYDERHTVLRDINWSVPRGSRIGIVGRTGCGKSTLVDLFVGLLQPTAGAVLIDGVPLSDGNLDAWQTRLAYAPQNIFLTDASIAANIAFGEAEIDLPRAMRAARMAAASAFIDALPQGFDTVVGERGVSLSEGQRQRIGIARALYRRPEFLILDEATSALDGETEREVLGAIMPPERDMTVVVIAHRPSALAGCDTIFEIRNGTIDPSGQR